MEKKHGETFVYLPKKFKPLNFVYNLTTDTQSLTDY